MGKTIRHEFTHNLFHNGDRRSGHSLIKDWRNLLSRRDYKSDRAGDLRHISSQLCRTRLNIAVQKEIEQELENI